MRRRLAAWILGSTLALAGAARAQLTTPDEVPLEQVIEVLLVDRDLLAIDARNGGQLAERLDLDESVLWLGARGNVGVAVTNQRVLAAATGSGSWQEKRYQRGEGPPAAPTLGDRVALALTNRRVLGFDGGGGNFVEYRLGPKERVLTYAVGPNVALVVSDRSALGLSPRKGGFFRVRIGSGERIDSITTGANLGTLTTDQRVLIFRSPTGTWEERNRDLR